MDLSRDETVRRLLQNMQAHATLPHTTVRGHNGGGFSPRERERRDSVLRRRRYASADLPAAHMTAGRANRFRQQPPPHPPAPINVRHTHIKSKTHRERLLRTLGGVRGRQRSLGSAGLLCPTTPPAHQIFPPRSARKQSRLLRRRNHLVDSLSSPPPAARAAILAAMAACKPTTPAAIHPDHPGQKGPWPGGPACAQKASRGGTWTARAFSRAVSSVTVTTGFSIGILASVTLRTRPVTTSSRTGVAAK